MNEHVGLNAFQRIDRGVGGNAAVVDIEDATRFPQGCLDQSGILAASECRLGKPKNAGHVGSKKLDVPRHFFGAHNP